MAESMNSPVRALVEGKNFAHLSVNRRDGSIQSAVVWVDTDESGNLVVNSAEGRGWPNNLRREGRATVSIHNAENPYEFTAIAVSLAGDTHDGADDVIDSLAKKYMDVDTYPFRQEGEQRITFTLQPERINYYGG